MWEIRAISHITESCLYFLLVQEMEMSHRVVRLCCWSWVIYLFILSPVFLLLVKSNLISDLLISDQLDVQNWSSINCVSFFFIHFWFPVTWSAICWLTINFFFFLAYALHTKPGIILLISQIGWQTTGKFSIWTVVHNVWRSLWSCATGTGRIWSLIPADEVGCTLTLASAKAIQRWRQALT